MKTYIPRVAKNAIRRALAGITWDQWANQTWSQEGEDMVLRRIFEKRANGFYVDVGAHHPKRFSNTFYFYRRGWSGINIDAMPGSMKLFDSLRPRDINLEMGVAKVSGNLDYYIFNEPALNGFFADLAHERNAAKSSYVINDVRKIEVCPLSEILDKHLRKREIDFLSVDVEGLDLDVLESNNWSLYRPHFVLAEILGSDFCGLQSDPLVKFMGNYDYVIYAKTVNTVFFKDLRKKNE